MQSNVANVTITAAHCRKVRIIGIAREERVFIRVNRRNE